MKKCARCHKKLPDPAGRVYSAWTHNYYCANVDGCAKRTKRARKPAVAA